MKKAVSFLLILKSITWITLIANEKTNFLPNLKNFHDITLSCCSDYKKNVDYVRIFLKMVFPKPWSKALLWLVKRFCFRWCYVVVCDSRRGTGLHAFFYCLSFVLIANVTNRYSNKLLFHVKNWHIQTSFQGWNRCLNHKNIPWFYHGFKEWP